MHEYFISEEPWPISIQPSLRSPQPPNDSSSSNQLQVAVAAQIAGARWYSMQQLSLYCQLYNSITQYGSTVYIGIAMVYPH